MDVRDGRRMRWLEDIARDVRYGTRALLRKPIIVVVALLSLGLAIGANTTVFSLVNFALFRSPPGIVDPGRLVAVYDRGPSGDYGQISYPDYIDYRDQLSARSMSGLAAYALTLFVVDDERHAARVGGLVVSGNYFDVLGVRPALGRFFAPSEDVAPERDRVAVISHTLWQRRYAGDPHVIGRDIRLNGTTFEIIGVSEERFRGNFTGFAGDVFVPIAMHAVAFPGADSFQRRDAAWLIGLGRLRPGTHRAQAELDVAAAARNLTRAYPRPGAARNTVLTAPINIHPDSRTVIAGFVALLMAIVGLLLLLACLNLTALILARNADRRREIAIRLSIGASRGRLVRQLLVEAVLLTGAGGVAGLLLATWARRLLLSLVPITDLPISVELPLDWRVIAFAAGITATTALLVGVFPAFQSTHTGLIGSLREGTLRTPHRSRLRSALVVAQLAFSLMLLVGAGLLIRSLRFAKFADPGFDTRGVVVMSFDPHLVGYDVAAEQAFFHELTTHVRTLAGVRDLALASVVPLSDRGSTISVGLSRTAGAPLGGPTDSVRVSYNIIAPGYFKMLGISLLRGRDFSAVDDAAAAPAVIVNRTFAKQYWQTESPEGRSLRIGGTVFQVVGMAADGKYRSFAEQPQPFLYVPYAQQSAAHLSRGEMVVHVRIDGPVQAVLAQIRDEVTRLDPRMPVFDAQTMTDAMRVTLVPARIVARLLGIAGIIALALAVLGVYGITSYSVSQRTREIGLRVALGAQRSDVLSLVIGQAVRIVAAGTTIGFVLALVAGRALASFLFNVPPGDPITMISAISVLGVAALAASCVPARRAARVDAVIALRAE
jgi:predicted permease